MSDEELSPVCVACAQMRSGIDRLKNIDSASALIAEAAGKGAQFIVTPEVTNAADLNVKRLAASLPVGEKIAEIDAFSAAAIEHGVFLLIGSMAVKRKDGKLANRGYMFAPDGEIVARYDKLHMFDVTLDHGESYRESAMFEAGDEAVLVKTSFANIGLSICYDLRFPHLYRALARAGAEILCVPASFTKQTGRAHWKTLLTARAIECGAFVAAAAQGGVHEDGRQTWGHSMIISPWGDILAEAPGDEPCVILAELDLARVAKARRQIPNLALEKPIKVTTLEA